MEDSTKSLLAEIEAFLERHAMPHSTFGKSVVNDANYVKRLRAGGRTTLETAQKVRRFMSDHEAEASAA